MGDANVRLKRVRAELREVERQLQQLLDRQTQLLEEEKQLQVLSEQQATSQTCSGAKGDDFEKENFSWSTELVAKRQSVFGLTSFRPLQLATMNATLSGRDVVLIMPTGGGKSLCFQLPALASKGITLVVTPLVSLMEDQLLALQKLDVDAAILNASSDKSEVNRVHTAMTDKNSTLKLLYVTPEKLAKSKRFMNKLEKMHELGRFSRLVIDEVHCCSQWGHDFRPDYKFLGIMKTQFAGVPLLGLTATATASVIVDIQKMLHIPTALILRAGFNRKNLYYEVLTKPSSLKESVDDAMRLINSRFKNQSGIVYCFSQKDTEDVTSELQARNIRAGCYHAGMNAHSRSQVHQRWLAGKVDVVVATIAFGMGIDKPNVRYVIHFSISKSMENYYQESGRAGRDDERATLILYWSFSDAFRQSTMVFTEQTGLSKLYAMLAYACDKSRCRRSMIAEHFGEQWDVTDCQRMCDHCDPQHTDITQEHDVSAHCRDVIRILRHNATHKQRVTALKVLDAWQGKGARVNRPKDLTLTTPSLNRPDIERLLLHLLLEGYIREDFHFTAYSTISYLVAGSRGAQLDRPEHKVMFRVTTPTFKSKSPKASCSKSSKSDASLRPSAATTNNQSDRTSLAGNKNGGGSAKKRTPCVVSQGKSAFSSLAGSTNSVNESSHRHETGSKPISSVVNGTASKSDERENGEASGTMTSSSSLISSSRKRTCVIESSDSDSDLDFGEALDTVVKKRRTDTSKRDAINTQDTNGTKIDEELANWDLNCIEVNSD